MEASGTGEAQSKTPAELEAENAQLREALAAQPPPPNVAVQPDGAPAVEPEKPKPPLGERLKDLITGNPDTPFGEHLQTLAEDGYAEAVDPAKAHDTLGALIAVVGDLLKGKASL